MDWNECEKKLIRYQELKDLIQLELLVYEEEIQNNILTIQSMDYTEAKKLFIFLFNIQDKICMAHYKYQFPISDKLLDFLHDFDRQDEYNQKYLYERILKNELCYL